jgi:hypothetical protein
MTTGTTATFAFAPVAVSTASGTADIQVTGSVSFLQEDGVSPQVVFEMQRRASFSDAGNQQPRDNRVSEGSTRTARPLPGPDEVLSFELPPVGASFPAIADRFELRVQIGK